MALHHSKKNQDGYQDKQWDYVNRQLLKEREHEVRAINREENIQLRRRMRKWIEADSGRRVSTGYSDRRLMWGMGKNVPVQLTRRLGGDSQPVAATELQKPLPVDVRAYNPILDLTAGV